MLRRWSRLSAFESTPTVCSIPTVYVLFTGSVLRGRFQRDAFCSVQPGHVYLLQAGCVDRNQSIHKCVLADLVPLQSLRAGVCGPAEVTKVIRQTDSGPGEHSRPAGAMHSAFCPSFCCAFHFRVEVAIFNVIILVGQLLVL